MKNIVLIGYRGAGKSKLAKVLSKKIKLPVISLDKEIEKKAKMKIKKIVEKYGWDKFRDIETEVTKESSVLNNHIIDTGGGVIVKEKNIKNLKKGGKVFWLKAEPEVLEKRIKKDDPRPSLTGSKSYIEEVREVLKEREPKYEKASDYIIDASLPISEQINKIIKYL